ncbi:DNA topoisomerase 4 subunit A [Geitlerinema splendidum]|nr:DNA topoisomerase 4 subunit A [Geitlerinema splendidum]
MAKQLNLFSKGQVISTALHTEMQRSYLEYAMSVIVGRALPDVRDGMKPVHRRILYAMHELGLIPDRPYRKCARVVGDVLGKYHPHGDQAVYDALVRMVQDFSCRYPLLAGHGNFGSVDNDPPAAMRYTETRLAPISHQALLSEISEATVDFTPNFDNSQAEPVVLPAQLPILLLNGSSGIAVGMATNIPPHNLGEVVDGLIALIDRPDLSDEKLMELIPGPDFPTGGEIVGTDGIKEAFTTGRGSIPIRGIVRLEEIQPGKGRRGVRSALIVTELPFQVNKAGWIEKIAELVNQGRIEGIADLRDESDRTGMRVVIELKREANPQAVLESLYRLTPLQTNFGAILLALVDGQPRQLTLKQILQEFLQFRETTLTRQYESELHSSQKRQHLLEGLLKALENVDAVIEILRHAPDGTTAKSTLQQQLQFSDRQSDAILAMPMRRLTGLERQNLQTEHQEVSQHIQELQTLLGDRKELLKSLKKDLRALKRQYNDPRRTRIHSLDSQPVATPAEKPETSTKKGRKSQANTAPKDSPSSERLLLLEPLGEEPNQPAQVEFTHRGYVRRVPPSTPPKTKSKPPKKTVQDLQERDDFTIQTDLSQTSAEILVLTQTGKAHSVKLTDIPQTSNRSKGTPLISLLPQQSTGTPDRIVGQFVRSTYPDELHLIVLTQQGRIKRLPLSEFANMTARGLTAIKLKDDDELLYTTLTQPGDQLLIATTGGRILRLEVNDEQLPILGRAAQGYQVLRLRKQEQLAGCASFKADDNFLVFSQQGYVKRMPVGVLRQANRGEIGTQALQFTDKTDSLASMVRAVPKAMVAVLSSEQRLWQLAVDSIAFWGKDGKGDRLIDLRSEEQIVSVTLNCPC